MSDDIMDRLWTRANYGLPYRLARTRQFLSDQRGRQPDLSLLFSDAWADVADASDLIEVLEITAFDARDEISRLRERVKQLETQLSMRTP